MEIKPDDAETWYNKGNVFSDLKNLDEAIKCYDKALEIQPNYVDAWYNKGLALYILKNLDEAIKCYDKALEIKPDHANALKNKQLASKELEKRKYSKGYFSRFRNKNN